MSDPNGRWRCGIVEGFYGRPWTGRQRLELFCRMADLGLNAYVYAPKDDLKHRAIWREAYSDDELTPFREQIDRCERLGIAWVYALAPGLDIRFSDPNDRLALGLRFEQLRAIGARHFALLFDDLPGSLSDRDQSAYPSLAAAHCDVVNATVERIELDSDGWFLFCPTPYCDQMDRDGVGGAGYLDRVGRSLHPGVDVFWTGPDIVSTEIPEASIRGLAERIGRPPVVWDNLFANDYDFHRVHCGPYSGRERDLIGATRGILINPNNEFCLNTVPFRTFAEFCGGSGAWRPYDAYRAAVAGWHDAFATVGSAVLVEDVALLCDCFHLPAREGRGGEALVSAVEGVLRTGHDARNAAIHGFREIDRRVQGLFERLTELRDRDLFHAWSRYVWQLKEELLAAERILGRALRAGEGSEPRSDGGEANLDDVLPNTFRGGLLAKLERIITPAHG
ncbi:MAG: hypothetical protein FJ297_15815 [Planctomycetes bacterium]|nr:hypothetical protein [Planctomycetota bacterium]